MQNYYAHQNDTGDLQTILEHLRGTAELCKYFASKFQSEEQGYFIGMAHDIGKYSAEFQRRLLKQGRRVDHSTAGAFECIKRNQPFAAFCVAGHHGGLPDGGSPTDGTDMPSFLGRMNRAYQLKIPDYSSWTKEVSLQGAQVPVNIQKKSKDPLKAPLTVDFYIRMLFSCLTDADFLDTERFMSGNTVERDSGEPLSILSEKLNAYIAPWFPAKNELNGQRCAILKHCMEQGDNPALLPGLFTLTVPTGGGKTVASLAFALRHALTHGKSRIIYVVPYTSIIEQTAGRFKEILGDNNVLEHHSGVLYDIDSNTDSTDSEINSESQKMARATENWDKPVIVTTSVQFFESIYGNRSSKSRKLHNIVNSIVIFDEAQMLPLSYLRPCVSAIAQLVENYHVSAVLCTATQPSLDKMFREFLPSRPMTELCPPEVYTPDVFRRVTFQTEGMLTWNDLAERMTAQEQALCIVNTRDSAVSLYNCLPKEDGTFHLSTRMVPAHRRKVLTEIRQRLKDDLPCRVVATSLIEAGVDVDFPIVFREIAGLDSMLQAAGRCNREGKNTAGESIVVLFQAERPIPELFRTNAETGKKILNQYEDISSAAAVKAYFNELYNFKGEKAPDNQQILPMIQKGTFPFATVAEKFHLIDKNTRTVYVPWEKGTVLIDRLRQGERDRKLFREASQYAVELYENDFNMMKQSGHIVPIDHDEFLWTLADASLYSDSVGIPGKADAGLGFFV